MKLNTNKKEHEMSYIAYLECPFQNYEKVGTASTKQEAEKIGRSELKRATAEGRQSTAGYHFRNFCIYKDRMIHYPTPEYLR